MGHNAQYVNNKGRTVGTLPVLIRNYQVGARWRLARGRTSALRSARQSVQSVAASPAMPGFHMHAAHPLREARPAHEQHFAVPRQMLRLWDAELNWSLHNPPTSPCAFQTNKEGLPHVAIELLPPPVEDSF